jgi:hypothetical protein
MLDAGQEINAGRERATPIRRQDRGSHAAGSLVRKHPDQFSAFRCSRRHSLRQAGDAQSCGRLAWPDASLILIRRIAGADPLDHRTLLAQGHRHLDRLGFDAAADVQFLLEQEALLDH